MPEQWNCNTLPGTLVTDMGKEYVSDTFRQITDLGVTVVNLPPYRPELKGAVEKFFDVVQNLFKPHLKGKGVIEPNFQEQGSHDYRKDACLTMADKPYCKFLFSSIDKFSALNYNIFTIKSVRGSKPYDHTATYPPGKVLMLDRWGNIVY